MSKMKTAIFLTVNALMLMGLVSFSSAQTLVPGTAMTYTDGVNTWARNPYCGETGLLLKQGSPAIDFGVVVPGVHCLKSGSALSQPLLADGSFCNEWYGNAPDAGACEFVSVVIVAKVPNSPIISINVKVPNSATITVK